MPYEKTIRKKTSKKQNKKSSKSRALPPFVKESGLYDHTPHSLSFIEFKNSHPGLNKGGKKIKKNKKVNNCTRKKRR